MTNTILIIDDSEDNLLLLRMYLEGAGYKNVVTTPDPFHGLELFGSIHPDIVLLDLHMPGLNGFSMIGDMRNKVGGTGVPIVVLTGDDSSDARERALRAGASDFLVKPFDEVEIVLRVRNHLQLRSLHATLENRNRTLDAKVRTRTKELEAARLETLDRLAIAAEYRDDETGLHARRVGQLSASIAVALDLPSEHIQVIDRAAPLHDLGKIGVPDQILLKPGPLTNQEFSVMKQHTTIGASVLSGSGSRVLQVAETIAGTHHERWDGNGYQGLVREETPIEGRVVAVADAYDAITHDRPYRKGRSSEEAFEEISRNAGKHFDPAVVEAFFTAQSAGHIPTAVAS